MRAWLFDVFVIVSVVVIAAAVEASKRGHSMTLPREPLKDDVEVVLTLHRTLESDKLCVLHRNVLFLQSSTVVATLRHNQ